MKLLSKRQACLQYGFNFRTVGTLIDSGILRIASNSTPLRPKIVGFEDLVEGTHYIVCLECGAFQTQLSSKHLSACAGISLEAYLNAHPGAALLAASCNKTKTEAQKTAQSELLKARFKTEAGEVTRKQIAVAALKLQASGYREQASEHLRTLNSDPQQKAARSRETKARWASGEVPIVQNAWMGEHWEEVLESAAYARRHIKRKFTKPHARVKEAVEASGLVGFITEYETGYYSIDEARPDLRLAVEIDGCYWHGCGECGFPGVGRIKQYDASKTTYLNNRGWTIVRLLEHEIKADLEWCIRKVTETVKTLSERGVL